MCACPHCSCNYNLLHLHWTRRCLQPVCACHHDPAQPTQPSQPSQPAPRDSPNPRQSRHLQSGGTWQQPLPCASDSDIHSTRLGRTTSLSSLYIHPTTTLTTFARLDESPRDADTEPTSLTLLAASSPATRQLVGCISSTTTNNTLSRQSHDVRRSAAFPGPYSEEGPG